MIFVAQGSPTRLYGAVNTGSELVFNPIGPASPRTYNALGYHVPSRYLYAISNSRLWRIDDNGAMTDVAALAAGSNAGAFAGDIPDRFYYRGTGTLHWYNIANGNSGQVPLSQGFAPVDFAWSNGYFWGLAFQGTSLTANPTMYRMSTSGTVTTFPVPGITRNDFAVPANAASFGGAWTYGNGNLGFTNNSGGTVQIAVRNAGATPQFDVISFMDGPASDNNDAAASPGDPVDLAIAKSVDLSMARAGEALEYTLTVSNLTAGSVSSGYTVSDTLPAGVAVDETTLPDRCTLTGVPASGQTFTCAEAPLSAGVTRDLTFSVTIDAGTPRGTLLTNAAIVLGNEADPVASNNSATATTTVAAPKLTLAKSVAYSDANGNGNPDVGETLTWTFTVRNTGDYDATDVSIDDPQVSGITPAAEDIAVGGTQVFTATSTVTQGMADAGSFTNTATATGTVAGAPFVTPPSSSTVTIRQFPSLEAVKEAHLDDENGNGVADEGETIDYEVVVTNTGNVTLTDIFVDDTIVTLSPANVASLAPGDDETFTGTYTVTAADVAAGSVVNVASASGRTPGGDPIESEETTTTTETIRTGLTLVKSAADPDQKITIEGQVVTYHFIVTNTGNTVVNGATVIDPTIDPGSLTPVFATILPGEQEEFTATRTVKQSDIEFPTVIDGENRLTNTATASGTPIGRPSITSNSSTVLTPLVAHEPGLSVEKTATFVLDANANGKGDLGDVIHYRVTVTNTGNVTVSGIVLDDTMASTQAIGSLLPGEQHVFEYDHSVTQIDVDRGEVPNTATASGEDPSGGTVDSPPASTTTPTAGAPLLHAVKSAALDDDNNNGVADEGEEITYTVHVWNHGEVTAKGVTIDDPLVAFPATPVDIAPGASESFAASVPYVVTAADVAAGAVVNTATANGVDPRDSSTRISSPPTTTETPTPAPQLTIDKKAVLSDANGNGRADVGETISYSFVIANNGNVTLEDISVSDSRVTGLTPDEFDLAPGLSLTVTADPYVVTDLDVLVGRVDNSATATGTPAGGGTPYTTTPSTTSTPTVTADTSFDSEKIAILDDVNGNGYADVDETINYQIVVTNTGTLTLFDVAVADPMIGVVTPATQDIAPGQSVGFTGEPYVVTQEDVDAGEILNEATVTGTDAEGDPLTPQTPSTRVVTPPHKPSLATTKSYTLNDANRNGFADEDETIEFTVTVRNTGNVTLTDVAPNDAMIPTFTPASVDLAPGARQAFVGAPYTVTAADVAAGIVSNTATATGTPPSGPPISSPPATVTVTASDPGILIEKSADLDDSNSNGVADVGETIAYSFTVTNTGNVDLSKVTIDDPKVPGITPASATIAPGEVVIFRADDYTVTEADILAGVLSNTATAVGTLPGGETLESNPSTVTVPPAPVAPALTIDKKAVLEDSNDNGRADAGETIRFSFVVTNTGNVTLTGASVDDDMVTGLRRGQIGSIAPGRSVTVAADPYTMTAADAEAGGVYNVATATATGPGGGVVSSREDSVTVSAVDGNHSEDVDVLPPTGGLPVWPLALGAFTMIALGVVLYLRRRQSAMHDID